jgi:predicted TIM-barrel fold metal-dependent hydrolase
MRPITRWLMSATLFAFAACASGAPPSNYSMADFTKVRKLDAHVHGNVVSPALLEQAKADNFELMSINVDYPDFPALPEQRAAALAQLKMDPARFHWATTFSMQGFEAPGWANKAADGIAADAKQGARAVKIWKNIGMAERDKSGKLVRIDDPRIAPVADRIQQLGLTLIAHQAEPYNCWLPLDQMTTDNDREYFRNHPQYYMYLHPEMPSHADLMGARDNFVAAHPGLRFVGAHLASLEYDVDRIAAFLDRFPNASVDMAARMSQVQYQSVRDFEKVRGFFIKYQDRLLYGTDLTINPGDDPAQFKQEAHGFWTRDWRYLATDESQRVEMIKADVKGLALPRAVIDKIYLLNAERVFALRANAKQASRL